MQRKILVVLFLFITFLIKAEPFFSIYPNQLNFENYPIITTTCIIRNDGSFKMTKSNINKFNFSILENGLYIQAVTYNLIEIIDKDHAVVKLSFASLSPLYMNRDINFYLNAEDHFTFDGENYIFYNNGNIVNHEMKPYSPDEHLTPQESNQNTIQPDPSLLSDKSLFECSHEELLFMRNTYYAQKGYIFKNNQLKKAFRTQQWYTPTLSNLKNISFTEEEKAEIAYIQFHEALKSEENGLTIDVLKYDDDDMVKEILYKAQKSYNFWAEKEKQHVFHNISYVSIDKEKRQPKKIGYFNLYHKQEQFREYYPNGIVKEEVFIRKNGSNLYTAFVDQYHNTGKKRKESEFLENLSNYDIESFKNSSAWYMVWEYYLTKSDNSEQPNPSKDIYEIATVYDFYTPQTPSEKEMNQIVKKKLTSNSDNEYVFEELKSIYELKYPKNNWLQLSTNNYIKKNNLKYNHSLDLYNNEKSQLLCDQHEISYIYVSTANERYEQKLYNKNSVLLKAQNRILYDDSDVREIDGTYKVQNWNEEEKQLDFVDIFHPDMQYGTYIIYMKVTFPDHKKTFYSEKYKLEYVPIADTLNPSTKKEPN
ncbi:YARHG domain-containing protein [Aquimarina pacifica]|uniref:YARHG domain-containing protein n=1 Tax=Aquimarina pacifica TaxID=1296415 RepID=UPI00046FBC2A|nr:YARHG domain-containing protein [Aquimarina pacifica]